MCTLTSNPSRCYTRDITSKHRLLSENYADVPCSIENTVETAQELVTRAPAAVREMAQDAQELATRTPAAVKDFTSRIPLPPSPAAVTDAISHQQEVISSKVEELWNGSGITETSDYLRELLSSVHSVQILFTLLEAYGLQKDVLPWDIELTIPKIPALGADERTLYLPDLFSLLGGHFWTTSLVWLTTSVGIPLLFAYFFNFTYAARPAHATRAATRRNPQHSVDHLTFNVVKGLMAWLVYAQGFTYFGAVADSTVSSISSSMWGGYLLPVIGASTGALFSLQDAILRKQ